MKRVHVKPNIRTGTLTILTAAWTILSRVIRYGVLSEAWAHRIIAANLNLRDRTITKLRLAESLTFAAGFFSIDQKRIGQYIVASNCQLINPVLQMANEMMFLI